jgi:integrase
MARHFIVQLPGGYCIAATDKEDQQLALDTIRAFIDMQQSMGGEMPLTATVTPGGSRPAPAPVEVMQATLARPAPQIPPEDDDPGTPLYADDQPFPSSLPPLRPLPVDGPHKDTGGNAPLGIYQQILPRTLSVAAEYYLEEIDGELSPSTVKRSRFVLRILKDLIGDRLVHTIDTDDMRVFVKTLKSWPSHAATKKSFSGLTPKKLVERAMEQGHKVISTTTCQQRIDLLRAFFRWCKAKSYLFHDLLVGARRFATTATPVVKKKPFADNELRSIFDHAKLSALTEPHKFWVPLLGLFQGMRVNEAAQLYVDDISVDRIPTITISGEREGQNIKTRSSNRLIPIHPMLIELGFLDYVEDLRQLKSRHLFPGLRWGKSGPGESISNWFNRTVLKKCGITTKQKTLHSLRHTFCTSAERHQVRIHRIARLVGHAPSGDTTLEHYVGEADVPECLKDIKKVRYSKLDIPKYNPDQFRTYLKRVTAPAYAPRTRRTKEEMESAGMTADKDVLSMLL